MFKTGLEIYSNPVGISSTAGQWAANALAPPF